MPRVTFLAPDTDAYVASVNRHAAEFTERTQIVLDVEILESDGYFSNAIHDRLGDGSADVFMSGPVLLWEHVGAGFVQPLDEFVANASEDWNQDDFIPSASGREPLDRAFRRPARDGAAARDPRQLRVVQPRLRARAPRAARLDVPSTWDAYFATAEELIRRSGGAVRGFGQRGKEAWHTMYTGYATQIWSCGGRDFGDDLRCSIARPEVVEPTQRFVEASRAAGPQSWTEQRWYELALGFAAGEFGLIVDSDHYVAIFEDPALSTARGEDRVCAAAHRPQRGDRPEPLDMVARDECTFRRQAAAWRFIEWASSPEFLLRRCSRAT